MGLIGTSPHAQYQTCNGTDTSETTNIVRDRTHHPNHTVYRITPAAALQASTG